MSDSDSERKPRKPQPPKEERQREYKRIDAEPAPPEPVDDRMLDTAAKRRQIALTKELGEQMGLGGAQATSWLWAKFPNALIEAQMDLPPVEEFRRAQWHPIPGHAHDRVFAAYVWHSWCWPACMPYAVVMDEGRHEILRDEAHSRHYVLLTQERLAKLLGMSQQRLASLTTDLIEWGKLYVAIPKGRKSGHAVYPNPAPFITQEQRDSYKSTLCKNGVTGPRLEPAVLRSFTKLLNKLGDDNERLSVPPEAFVGEMEGQAPLEVTVGYYRTRVWRELFDARTTFVEGLKALRYPERSRYQNARTRAAYLIDQRQRPETPIQSSSSLPALAPPARPQSTDESAGSAPSSYTGPTTTSPATPLVKDTEFYSTVSEWYRKAGKGLATPKQLADAYKLMPADASLRDFENFLFRPVDAARMDRTKSVAALLTQMAEFATDWRRGARDRQRIAAEEDDRAAKQERRERQEALLADYSQFVQASVDRLLAELPPDEKRRRVKEATAQLRKEGRWEKLAPEARDREIDRLITLDVGRAIPSFDDWLEQGTKGAS